jgi:hypothetical protein
VFNGGFASTVYSSNGGGVSATTQEGFGTDSRGYPYLVAAPYLTRNTGPWTVKVALSDLAARFGERSGVTGAHVAAKGPSGRALQVALEGPAGAHVIDARTFASGLGLRSTLFTLRIEEEVAAPPVPAAGDFIQVPPDEATAQAPIVSTADATTPRSAGAVPRLPSGRALGSVGHRSARHRWPIVAIAVFAIAATAVAQARRRGVPEDGNAPPTE